MRKFHLGLWNETFQHLGGKDGGGGIAYLLSTVNIQLIAGRIAPETVWIHRKQESFQGEHCVITPSLCCLELLLWEHSGLKA